MKLAKKKILITGIIGSVLLIVGIILTCYGITKIMVSEEMALFEALKIMVIFVLGFIAIVTSIVFIQKRSLEIIIEANNTTEAGKQAKLNIKSLIFNKKVYEEGPKVVLLASIIISKLLFCIK